MTKEEEMFEETFEEFAAKMAPYLIENGKMFQKIVLGALKHGLDREDYMLVCKSMWDGCPHIGDLTE